MNGWPGAASVSAFTLAESEQTNRRARRVRCFMDGVLARLACRTVTLTAQSAVFGTVLMVV